MGPPCSSSLRSSAVAAVRLLLERRAEVDGTRNDRTTPCWDAELNYQKGSVHLVLDHRAEGTARPA